MVTCRNATKYAVLWPSEIPILAIYAPIICTAPCVMFLMRAECRSITWASGRGLGPGNREFLGPVKWHLADRRVPFGPQKTRTNCNVHKETLRYIKIDLNFTKVRNYFEKR
jgi:hypothetical protein